MSRQSNDMPHTFKKIRSRIAYYKCVIRGLVTGFYKIKKCPVCGHLYLGQNSVCSKCGYDPFSDVFEYFLIKKQEYLATKNEKKQSDWVK